MPTARITWAIRRTSSRVEEHQDENGATYTRGRTPVSLRHVETDDSRGAALSREHEIKQLTRSEKAELIGERTGDS